MKKILLIGGGGFLGKSLIPALQREGWSVDVLLREAKTETSPGVEVFLGGLGNCQLLRNILPNYAAVAHLASGTTPGISAQDPTIEAELNIFPTLRFLEVLQAFPHIHLLYISSGGTVYGNPPISPVSENTPVAPLSYYGAGKAATEQFLLTFSRTFDRRVSILRPSNLYGPGQPYYRGFGIIRTMLQHAVNGSTMDIWGDGENTRDFIYVADLVSAITTVLTSKKTGTADIFNVGSGIGYSLNRILGMIERVSGKDIEVRYSPKRAIDVRDIALDSSRLRDLTGWRPETKIEEGIRNTWLWLHGNK